MAKAIGNDTTMWLLPDGDFLHGELLMVDTADWSLDDFRLFDNCSASERASFVWTLDAIKRAGSMSVVEITITK